MIQTDTHLIVCGSDWTIRAYSASMQARSGFGASMQVGVPLAEALGRTFDHDARGWLQTLQMGGGPAPVCGYRIGEATFDISCHEESGLVLLALEASRTAGVAVDALARRFLLRLGGLDSHAEVARAAVRALRVFARADAAFLLSSGHGEPLAVLAADPAGGAGALPVPLDAALNSLLIAGSGRIAAVADSGQHLIGGSCLRETDLPATIGLPPPAVRELLTERSVGSVAWIGARDRRGGRLIAYCESRQEGAIDAPRRRAMDLGLQVLQLQLECRA